MAKGSGSIRRGSSVGAVLKDGATPVRKSRQDIVELRKKFPTDNWELETYRNGGYIATSLQRIEFSKINKKETQKFNKEHNMCKHYAHNGFQIEHKAETPGISSSDVNVIKHGNRTLINVNGKSTDLKSLSSANNIIRHAKNAVGKQGADIVMFEFTRHAKGIERTLNELSRKGTYGYYYYSDEGRYHSF